MPLRFGYLDSPSRFPLALFVTFCYGVPVARRWCRYEVYGAGGQASVYANEDTRDFSFKREHSGQTTFSAAENFSGISTAGRNYAGCLNKTQYVASASGSGLIFDAIVEISMAVSRNEIRSFVDHMLDF